MLCRRDVLRPDACERPNPATATWRSTCSRVVLAGIAVRGHRAALAPRWRLGDRRAASSRRRYRPQARRRQPMVSPTERRRSCGTLDSAVLVTRTVAGGSAGHCEGSAPARLQTLGRIGRRARRRHRRAERRAGEYSLGSDMRARRQLTRTSVSVAAAPSTHQRIPAGAPREIDEGVLLVRGPCYREPRSELSDVMTDHIRSRARRRATSRCVFTTRSIPCSTSAMNTWPWPSVLMR